MTTTHLPVPVRTPLRLAERLPELRAALQQQRRFRFEQLRELAEMTPRSSRAVGDVHDEVREILRTSATSALAETEAALNRMRAGSYGICERCTQPIPYERLEILPVSRYCMRCQHIHEMHSARGMTTRSDTSMGPILASE